MTAFVTIYCDGCNAKVGDGTSVKAARRDANDFGAQRIDGSDFCARCAEDEA